MQESDRVRIKAILCKMVDEVAAVVSGQSTPPPLGDDDASVRVHEETDMIMRELSHSRVIQIPIYSAAPEDNLWLVEPPNIARIRAVTDIRVPQQPDIQISMDAFHLLYSSGKLRAIDKWTENGLLGWSSLGLDGFRHTYYTLVQ